VHSLIDNTFLECGDLGLHKIISLHESRYSQIEQHIHAIYISRRAPRITLSHCYLFVLADPAVVDQGGDCHTLQACMLPLWRETFSKAHHRGSGYAGTGVIAKYSRKSASSMGRSIHQPSAGEFVESGGFTPHGVGRTPNRKIECRGCSTAKYP
jgi:hypothetical protein